MRSNYYSILAAILLTTTTGTTQAQNWRHKNEGLPSKLIAKTVYGEGKSILVTNSTLGTSNLLFHRPDTTTAFASTTSSFGPYSGVLSQIVKAKGALFAGTTDGLFRSTDNGVTWAPASSSSTSGYVYSLYAINDTLYGGVGTGLGKAMMSTDTGKTWTSLGYTGFMAANFVKQNGVLYVGSSYGLVYTPDNGATWKTPVTTGLYAPIITGLATLAGSVYAACSTGVYKTIDDGANWTVVLPKSMFSLTTIDTALLGGTNNSGIYQSDKSGTNWNTINTGLPYVGAGSYNAVNCITYNSEFVIASLQGDSSIYVTNLSDLGLNPTTPVPPTTGLTAKEGTNIVADIYPNPTTDRISVDFRRSTNEPISINIMDASGRLIYSTTTTNSKTEINLEQMAQGNYYVHITQGSTTTTQKISIVR